MKKTKLVGFSVIGTLMAIAGAALAGAANGYTLFGDAMLVYPGNMSKRAVRLRSEGDLPDVTFGGISFEVPPGTTFGDLDVLSTDFRLEADDECIGGAPRFQIAIDTDGDGDSDGNIFAYFGSDSLGMLCVPGTWENTGDFLETDRRLDTTQLPGGAFFDPYNAALMKYGSFDVVSITVVIDASWAHPDFEQTVLIDNTNVDGTLYNYDTPRDKNDCKYGRWRYVVDAQGKPFVGEAHCARYVTGGVCK